ncbi:hypothetical protein ACFFP0_29975 [Rhizobium puerariae]|uniref:DUF2336 domain-containing protein n=1 Tax=Rhizobium puerariae TaxID=1585791 RepID=A0ABV6AR30_9HYPH
MLPPVRATLSSFVDYQAQSPQPVLRQRIDVASNPASAETTGSMPLSGGRLDILSLSAQLQLAHGFSIFAETVGKLIRLPRREGEALLDYAQRLMEAVKAMSPAQQAALERALNQLVKGISLRLLTEILNNPAGPDAARFAVRMETAQLLDRDLAARAVVSSYRQNAGADPAIIPPPRPANAGAAPSSQAAQPGTDAHAASQAGATDTPAAGAGDIGAGAADGQEAPVSETILSLAGTKAGSASREPAASAADMEAAAFAPTGEDQLQAEGSAESDAATATGQDIIAEEAEGETPGLLATREDDMPERSAAARHPDGGGRENALSAAAEKRNASPVFYDGPALARLSQRSLDQTRPSAAADRAKLATLAEWLAEVFADGNSELLEPLPAAARTLPEQLALEELLDGESPARPLPLPGEETAAPLSRPGGQAATEPENPASARSAGTPANAGGQPAGAPEPAEQLALPLPLPHVLREGVPLPYVPYPPEEQERDPEERKTREISKTDEDGEQQHSSGEQAFHDERAAEDESAETHEDAAGEDAEDASRANDLYWRMAGWA